MAQSSELPLGTKVVVSKDQYNNLRKDVLDPTLGHQHTGQADGGAPVVNLQSGLDVDKPASPNVGDVYIAQDTGKVYVCFSAGSWTYLPYIGLFDSSTGHAHDGSTDSGAPIVMADVTLSADADYIDVTGLDINSHGAYAIYYNVVNPLASNARLLLYVEGDYTDTDYYTQTAEAGGTTISASRVNAPYIGDTTAGSDTTGCCILFRDPNGYAHWIADTSRDAGASVRWEHYAGASTFTVTNITSVRIASAAVGGLGAGTRVIVKHIA